MSANGLIHQVLNTELCTAVVLGKHYVFRKCPEIYEKKGAYYYG